MQRVRGLHPASVIVFLIGVVLGITGVTLAIVFGVKCNNDCPTCPTTPSNSITDCDAKVFSIRTGVNQSTGILWSDDLNNSSSSAFISASTTVGQSLTDTLQGSSSSARVVILDTQPVKYVVIVTKFEKGQNNMVIAYASAAATGESDVITSFNNLTEVAGAKLKDTDTNVLPAVNVDSMQFCNQPNTDLNSDVPVPPTCPSTDPPPVTCPPLTSATCEPCPMSTDTSTTCQSCPTIICPTQTAPTEQTCPPPVVCPTASASTSTFGSTTLPTTLSTTLSTTLFTFSSSSTPSPTGTPCPVCPDQPSCPTAVTATPCPVCEDCPTSLPPSTCPAVTCPETGATCPPPVTCPTVSSTTCEPCPTMTMDSTVSTTAKTTMTSTSQPTSTSRPATASTTMSPTNSATTCAPCECSTPIWPSTSSITVTTETTSTSLTSTTASSAPFSTTSAGSTSTAQGTTSTGLSSSTVTTSSSFGTTVASSTSSSPASTSSASSTAISSLGTTTVPVTSSQATVPSTSQGSTVSSSSSTMTMQSTTATVTTTSGTTSEGTTAGSSTPSTMIISTSGSTGLSTLTSSLGTTTAGSSSTATTGGSTSTAIPTSSSSSPAASTSSSETSSAASTSMSSTPASSTVTTTASSTAAATSSVTSTTVSSTVASTTASPTTTAATTITTTMRPCPGGKYVYDGDIAIIFEATYLADSKAQNDQNVMMNTFISTQLLQYGNGGRTATQQGGYDLEDQITRVLPVPYPTPDSHPLPGNSFALGPRSAAAFNSSLVVVDQTIDPTDGQALIDDGLQYTIKATDRGNYSAAVVVGISNDFINQANVSAQLLRNMGYHIFTVALGSTKDFSLLASDAASVFTLPNPRTASDAKKVSDAIGDFLISRSYQCVGATTTATESTVSGGTTLSTLPTIPTTTTAACEEEYLIRDAIYMFEDTIDGGQILSNMSTTFLNTLIPMAQTDLKGSGKSSPYSVFSMLSYPDSENTCIGFHCNFGSVPISLVSFYGTTFLTAATVYGVQSSANGINESLTYSQSLQMTDGTPRNDSRDEIIVLFANSVNGVATAQDTAKGLRDNNNVGIITVAVGGSYQLDPLSSPGFQVHHLDSTVDPIQLAQEIVADMKTFGTSCPTTATTSSPETKATGQTATSTPAGVSSSSVGTGTTTSQTTMSTTPPVCKERYIKRDVVYMFEDTVDGSPSSTKAATFLNTLIPMAQRDILGSGKDSTYSNFSILPYPNSDETCLNVNCNFGQVPIGSVYIYTQAFLVAANFYNVVASPNGTNEGLIYSKTLPMADGSPRNDGRDEIIVLFANSGDGVAAAQDTAKSLRDNNNVGIITVAVGGSYQLDPLSSPGFQVHLLDSTTEPNQLAQEIITDMASLGTVCIV